MKKALKRIGIVLVAYVAAFVFAYVVTHIRIAFTSGPDRQSAPNMFAFGDDLYFVTLFVLGSIPATGIAFYFLRPYPWFWRIAAALAICVSVTGIAALVTYLVQSSTDKASTLGLLEALSPLRVLAAPLFSVMFVLSLLFAPTMRIKMVFLSVAAIEVIVFLWIAFIWWRQPH